MIPIHWKGWARALGEHSRPHARGRAGAVFFEEFRSASSESRVRLACEKVDQPRRRLTGETP